MTFTIESLGCAKNQVDSEQLIAQLERSGLEWVAEPERAEAVIVNTCGFITSAKEESIRTALELKSRFPGKKVLLAGCLVARYGEELRRSLGELDGFVGLNDPRGLQRLLVAGESRAEARPSGGERPRGAARHLLSYPGSAYLKIAEGCGNRCSYCAIPLIRGPLVSRPPAEVVQEARELLEAGVRELVLIAQAEHIQAVGNIEKILKVPGIDAVFVGPFDLSGSMGKPGRIMDDDVQAAMTKVRKACFKRGVPVGIFAKDVEFAKKSFAEGYSLLCVGTDTTLLSNSASQVARSLR